jgi:hypothetical protein
LTADSVTFDLWRSTKSAKELSAMPIEPAQRQVIAHFTTAYMIRVWACCAGLIGAYALWVRSVVFDTSLPAAAPENGELLLARHLVEVWGLWVIGAGLGVMLVGLCAVTYATIVNRWAALWIEGGRLTYVYRRVLDAPLAEVTFVGLTAVPVRYGILRTVRKNCLTVRLRSGKDVNLPTRYAEDVSEVIALLQKRIGLPTI